ncbi:MAG: alpha/beta hydrolase domain-containing protein [Aquabacterium sp.]
MKTSSMRRRARLHACIAAFVATFAIAGTVQAEAATLAPQTGTPANASPLDLAAYGVAEQEFFMQGSANAYTEAGPWRKDGVWPIKIQKAGQPYTTRLLARYPRDAARFNGTVIVEWLNVTGGIDVEIDGIYMAEEWLAKGYAWVGVSAQKAGLDGIKKAYAGRYDALSIPNDALSYDIFSDAARMIRTESATLLGGLKPQRLLATGQSQSALRLTTYVNALAPQARLFDAYLIHSRGSFPAGIDSFLGGPLVARIRTDLDVPVFQLQTEFDTGPALGALSRQPDTPRLRTWEVAGAAHIDQYGLDLMNAAIAGAAGESPLSCSKPFNNLPFYRVEKAVLRHLQAWMTEGKAPPSAPPITTSAQGTFVRDGVGNALGGVRLPEVEAPTFTYALSNSAKPGSATGNILTTLGCVFVGSAIPLTDAQLQGLYTSRDDYVARYGAAADAAVKAGHLLPDDAQQGLMQALSRAKLMPLP